MVGIQIALCIKVSWTSSGIMIIQFRPIIDRAEFAQTRQFRNIPIAWCSLPLGAKHY